MFKNVYSLGESNIEPRGIEVEIIRDLGGDDEKTHSNAGNSYLSIFGLDSEDENHQKVDGGDGKIDLYGSLLNLRYGELILPSHLPFSYDMLGSQHIDLHGVIPELNQENNSPAMYYDTNQDEINSQHEFVIKVKTSSRSSSMSLGFMIVEGSETVRLGGSVLQKDIDYTIDYFSGTINFINPGALDPTAEISVSYEENTFISFDQKLYAGTYWKYDFGYNDYLGFGAYYYNQSIAEEKVSVGYEPFRNFMLGMDWKYDTDLPLLNDIINNIPSVQAEKPSMISLMGNYNQITTNPNPLGQAFIDDFESAKRSTYIHITYNQWKMASPPADITQTIQNRGRMIWYNPYEDELTKNIWPEQSTSTRANNNTTKTLHLETEFMGDSGDSSFWNGIMIPLYSSEHDQSLTKYLDIWLNAEGVQDDNFKLHIDIGHISEDWNNNQVLDTEDEPVYGPGIGDGILSDGEDIGVDNCTDSYEDGWGGCLCDAYNEAIYDSDLDGIYNHPEEFCIDPESIRYEDALVIMTVFPDSMLVNPNADKEDPNGDNWCYNTTGCFNSYNYSRINGTEGNGQALGYRYPDSEDLDKNNTLDTQNHYFTVSILPKLHVDHPESMVITETLADGSPTGWKLIRIPLTGFSEFGDPAWNDVPTFRMRLESAETVAQSLKIAKIELVENDWQEIGVTSKFLLADDDALITDSYFSVSVINTDESTQYKNSLADIDIVLEHDEYNDIDMKEQSLVISFEDNPDCPESGCENDSLIGGIPSEHAVLIKNIFPALQDKYQSYFNYEKMEMFVHGGDPESKQNCDWCGTDTSVVGLLFRIGKDDNNYYEIHQPVYEGWNDKNHIDINIDKLTQLKIPTIESPAEELNDVGLDGFSSQYEDGCVGMDVTPFGGGYELSYTYENILDSLNISPVTPFYQMVFVPHGGEPLIICGQEWWNEKGCTACSNDDPNGDKWNDCGSDRICSQVDFDGTEGNGIWDNGEGMESNNKLDYIDINGDGLISLGETELAVEDYNGDGIYTPHANYDYNNEFYYWDNPSDISNVCSNCTQLKIKGTPSINNIQTIIMGVINNSDERIYGTILVNELRMTGVKQNRTDRSLEIDATINLSDIIRVNTIYNNKSSGYHKLNKNKVGSLIASDASDQKIAIDVDINLHKLLPEHLGIDIPLSVDYSKMETMPDFVADSDHYINLESNQVPDSLREIDNNLSAGLQINRNKVSTNPLVHATLDAISYRGHVNKSSANWSKGSSKRGRRNSDGNTESDATSHTLYYKYIFHNKLYFSPFAWLEKLSISNKLNSIEFNLMPERINLSASSKSYNYLRKSRYYYSDYYKIGKNIEDRIFRKYQYYLSHRLSDKLKYSINKQVNYGGENRNSNDFVYSYDNNVLESNKTSYNRDLALSRNREKYYFQYNSSITDYLRLNLSYHTDFKLIREPRDSIWLADIFSAPVLQTNISWNLPKLIQKYTSHSSILNRLSNRLTHMSIFYKYSQKHDYYHVNDIEPEYGYKLGFTPKLENVSYDTTYVGNNSHTYINKLSIKQGVDLFHYLHIVFDYVVDNNNIYKYSSDITEYIQERSFISTYYPMGYNGEKGFPVMNWNVQLRGLERLKGLRSIFKLVYLSHNHVSSKTEGFENDTLYSTSYNRNLHPLLGVDLKTKGKSPIFISIKYNYNHTFSTFPSLSPIEHITNSEAVLGISYNLKNRFVRFTKFSNHLTFSHDLKYSIYRSYLVENENNWNEQAKDDHLLVNNNILINFSRGISGKLYFIYDFSRSLSGNESNIRDYGFNLTIKLQNF
jgi:hypothetical protein